MTIAFDSMALFMLIFVRLSGMILLNPLLSRRNVPMQTRMGLIFFLTVLLAPQFSAAPLAGLNDFDLVVLIIKELAVGALLGYVFQVFYYMLFFVGDYLDTAFGMAMAKVFDPGTNIQMSITSNLFSVWFIIYLLATGGHLALIHLFAASFQLLPVGKLLITPELAQYGMQVFISAFSLAVRLLLPFAVAEFTLEVSMGILMKVIPQIHIFVINFQLKMGLGILMLLLFAPSVGSFVDNYLLRMLDTLQQSLIIAGGVV